MDSVKMRRIIGVIMLILWVIAFVPRMILEDNTRLVWHMDNWALLFVPIITIVYFLLLTIYVFRQKKHWVLKVLAVIGFIAVFLFCVLLNALELIERFDYKLWGDKNYVVYEEYLREDYGCGCGEHVTGIETVKVIYKRNGLVDKKLCNLSSTGYISHDAFAIIENILYKGKHAFTFYEPLDLVKEDHTYDYMDGKPKHYIRHVTSFYNLSTGQGYYTDKEWDSINRLIKNSQYH